MEDFDGNVAGGNVVTAPANNGKVSGTPSEGAIAKQIGTGDNANNSFVYITIRYSFLIGVLVSLALYVLGFESKQPADMLELIKGVWSIFMPVITLALGYAFGKGKQA